MTLYLSTLVFGAALVGIYFWSRYDEPSYESQTEYFARYQPRFSTSHTQYLLTKSAYVLLILVFYMIFASVGAAALLQIVPSHLREGFELFTGIHCARTQGAVQLDPGVPLIAALLIITFREFPLLKGLERRLRGSLHALAHIPEGVRKTVRQMRSSDFGFENADAIAAQIQKIRAHGHAANLEPGSLNSLLTHDEILRDWCCLGCVLFALSEQHRTRIGINDIFFDKYRNELESINDDYAFLINPMRERVDILCQHSSSFASELVGDYGNQVARMLNSLRDRLYTFVACGVRSSLKTDIECIDSLKRLGFDVQHTRKNYHIILPIIVWALGAIAVVSVIATVSTVVFCDWLGCYKYKWIKFPTPLQNDGNLAKIFLWTWATAALYFMTSMGALLIRIARIDRREWFDINDLKRNIPFMNYPMPVVAGAVAGGVTLFIIALFGPNFSRNPFHDPEVAFQEAFYALLWLPLAILMALLTLWLMDADVKVDPRRPPRWQRMRKFLFRGILSAAVMAATGGLLGWLSLHQSDAANIEAEIYTSAFLAFLIGLFVLVLSIVIQTSVHFFERGQRLADQPLRGMTPQGQGFTLLLDSNGGASWFTGEEKELSAANARGHGRWVQFPEGTVVQWIDKLCTGASCGDLGLISTSGGYQIYEAYNGRISGAAEFDARLKILAVTHEAGT